MATPVSKGGKNTPDNLAYEVFKIENGAGDTTFTITPTSIVSILFVTVTGLNAAANTGVDGYLTSFKVGDGTVEITGLNSAIYLVKVEGMIA